MEARGGSAGEPSALFQPYLLAVSVLGPLAALAVAAAHPERPGTAQFWWAATLTGLAALASRFPLQLGHKTWVLVDTAAYLAMILVLPPGLPGLLAALAALAGLVTHRRDWVEVGFNVGATALYVAAGALVWAWAREPLAGGPGPLGAAGAALAVALVAAVLHLGTTALVAGAVALQEGLDPGRVWARSLAADLPAHVALTALGATAAYTLDHPVGLLAMALPVALVYRGLRDATRLRADTHEALATLVEVVELRDPYTAGHSRRVAATARALALRLGLTAEEAEAIESAGRVHDVGKVALDPAILAKAGPLTDAEWAEMRTHPGRGAEVVARFAAYGAGHRLVRHHHERWDGAGYPDGLAGEAIPLGARILAVADTFDALTSARPYRAAMGPERALRILEEGAGSQWDGRVVAALVELRRAERRAAVGIPEGAAVSATA